MIAAASSTCIAQSSRPRLVTCGAPATAASSGEDSIRRHERPERVRVHVGVGVGDHDQLVPGAREAGVELLGLAAVDRVAQHADSAGRRPPPRAPPPRCRRWSRHRGPAPRTAGSRRPAPRARWWRSPPPRCTRESGRVTPGQPPSGSSGVAGALLQQPEHEAAGDPQRRGASPGTARRTPAARQARSAYRRSSRRRPSVDPDQHDRREDERRSADQQPELDRVRAVKQPGGDHQRAEPQDRPEHERRDQPAARRRAQRLERARRTRASSSGPGMHLLTDRRSCSRARVRASNAQPATLPARAAAGPAGEAGGEGGDARPSPSATTARRAAEAGPRSGSRTRTPRGGRGRAAARRPASADRAAARFAAGSRPARARSSSTQPIPAAPLSSPTWTGTVGSPGSLGHAPTGDPDGPQPDGRPARDVAVLARRRCVIGRGRLTQAMPAAPSSNPDALDASCSRRRPAQPARPRRRPPASFTQSQQPARGREIGGDRDRARSARGTCRPRRPSPTGIRSRRSSSSEPRGSGRVPSAVSCRSCAAPARA